MPDPWHYNPIDRDNETFMRHHNIRRNHLGQGRNRTTGEVLSDFFALLDMMSAPSGCWIWKGGQTKQGYGKLKPNTNLAVWPVHRYSWAVFNGPIPKGLHVCHNCPGGDNPLCCNPDHLFVGTQRDNVHDCMNKGRRVTPRGSQNGQSKLKEADVLLIRKRVANGDMQSEIAFDFGVSNGAVSCAIHRKTWKHVA